MQSYGSDAYAQRLHDMEDRFHAELRSAANDHQQLMSRSSSNVSSSSSNVSSSSSNVSSSSVSSSSVSSSSVSECLVCFEAANTTCGKGHFLCVDCSESFIGQACERDASSFSNGGVPCSVRNCDGTHPFSDFSPSQILGMLDHLAAAHRPKVMSTWKGELEAALGLECRACSRPVDPNPPGCNDFTCPCGSHICGCCMKTYVDSYGASECARAHSKPIGNQFCIIARRKGQQRIVNGQVRHLFLRVPPPDRVALLEHYKTIASKSAVVALNASLNPLKRKRDLN